ncbi:hypothetical protein I3760_11G202900 [Carya illinoinensis]|nr:hypothetical protein I3760_11G202900 [Carya illinoinensis]
MYGRFLEAPIKKIRLELHEKLLFPFKLWERTSFLALPHTIGIGKCILRIDATKSGKGRSVFG